MKKYGLMVLVLTIFSVFLSACSTSSEPSFAEIPAGEAFVDGESIYFAHTETSDPGVAEVLTGMMKSPVLVVPSLAEVPDSALSDVYVFKNGVKGMGPLNFQPDVFPNQPGDEGYTPLRKIVFVSWVDESQAKLLKSEEEIKNLVDQGALTLEESNIVVNMPFMTWKDGKR